jgi:hypothetical protein
MFPSGFTTILINSYYYGLLVGILQIDSLDGYFASKNEITSKLIVLIFRSDKYFIHILCYQFLGNTKFFNYFNVSYFFFKI